MKVTEPQEGLRGFRNIPDNRDEPAQQQGTARKSGGSERMGIRMLIAVSLIATALPLVAQPVAAHECAAYEGCDASTCKDGENHEHLDQNRIGRDEYCKSSSTPEDPPCKVAGQEVNRIVCEGPTGFLQVVGAPVPCVEPAATWLKCNAKV